jgi:hypothetical protein
VTDTKLHYRKLSRAKSLKNKISAPFLNKKAVATVYAALLSLILLLALFAIILAYYSDYNQVIRDQTNISQKRAQEKILIKESQLTDENLEILIENAGSIEFKVRAIYAKRGGVASFLGDPQLSIPPKNAILVVMDRPVTPSFSIIASTEKGTLSKEYFLQYWSKPTFIYDSENITIGSLTLLFNSFQYSIKSGNQWSDWQPGWTPPVNQDIRWKITIINISEETITLNSKSSLIASSATGPPGAQWYLSESAVILEKDAPVSLMFEGTKIPQGCLNQPTMVFLTLLGSKPAHSFGQTIPFQALIPRGS